MRFRFVFTSHRNSQLHPVPTVFSLVPTRCCHVLPRHSFFTTSPKGWFHVEAVPRRPSYTPTMLFTSDILSDTVNSPCLPRKSPRDPCIFLKTNRTSRLYSHQFSEFFISMNAGVRESSCVARSCKRLSAVHNNHFLLFARLNWHFVPN